MKNSVRKLLCFALCLLLAASLLPATVLGATIPSRYFTSYDDSAVYSYAMTSVEYAKIDGTAMPQFDWNNPVPHDEESIAFTPGVEIGFEIKLKEGFKIEKDCLNVGDNITGNLLNNVVFSELTGTNPYSGTVTVPAEYFAEHENSYDLCLVIYSERSDNSPISAVTVDIDPLVCGTEVTAEEEYAVVTGAGESPTGPVFYDWTTQSPELSFSIPADAWYVKDSQDIYDEFREPQPAGVLLEDESADNIFVGTIQGGENYYALIRLRAAIPFDEIIEFNVTGGTVKEYFSEYLGPMAEISPDNDPCWYALYIFVEIPAVHDPLDPVIENETEGNCITEASHDEVVYCSGCGAEIDRDTVTGNFGDHDWDEWKVTTEPTKTSKGEKTRICKNDDSHKETEEIPMLEKESYTVTFDPNGGTVNGKPGTLVINATEGEEITVPDAPVRDGYLFLGWKSPACQPGDKYTVTENHTFTAEWEKEEEKVPEKPDENKNVPKTGDDSNILLWCLVAAAAFIVIVWMIAVSIKNRKNQK